MEAAEILEKARSEPPPGWIVLPLLRDKAMLGIAGWVVGVIVGCGLFVLMAPIMIPHNYLYGVVPAIFSTLVLGLVLFVGIGSAWQLIVDTRRLLQADQHVIIITPEDFVMQEGKKIIHVPLLFVRHVTARGTPAPDRTAPGTRWLAICPTWVRTFPAFFLDEDSYQPYPLGARAVEANALQPCWHSSIAARVPKSRSPTTPRTVIPSQ